MKQKLNITLVVLFAVMACAFVKVHSVQAHTLSIEITEATRGGDRPFIWTQARAAVIKSDKNYNRAIMTLSKKLKAGVDVYYDLYQMTSKDGGATWTVPEVIPSLKIHHISNGYRRSMSDMTPQWHAATGKVLNIGKSFFYTDDRDPDRSQREVAYAVYAPASGTWGPYRSLDLYPSERDQ